MLIKEITEKQIWERFLLSCEEKTFLNSWNWGEFQKAMNNKIWRFGFYEEELVSVALIVKTIARRGTFLVVPHAPVSKGENKKEVLKTLLEKLKELGKQEKADFIRINPVWQRSDENNKIFEELGFRPAPIHAHPESSWKLDIIPSEEELLSNMRKTTRYLIRQAEKNRDIEIIQSNDIKDLDILDKIQEEVVKVQHFIPFSMEYIKNEFSVFNSDKQVSLFFGKYRGKIVAASFVLFWSEIGFYHHAALSPQYHSLPISYLMQWEAIKEAKKRGCRLYDFWGYVNPQKNPKHPWAGPTLFKMGFGGKAYEYVRTMDYPLSFKYWLTYIFEKIRRTKRGL